MTLRAGTPGAATADASSGESPWTRRRVAPVAALWLVAVALGLWVRPGRDDPTFLQTLLLPVWGALVAVAVRQTWRWLRPRGGDDRREAERRRRDRRDTAPGEVG